MTSKSPSRGTNISHLPTELLQHIFTHLDILTLIRLRRVSSRWNSLIPGASPYLQELLFLKPSKWLEAYTLTPATFDLTFDIVTTQDVDAVVYDRGQGFRPSRVFSLSRRCIGLIRMSEEIVFHPVVLGLDRYLTKEGFGSEVDGKASWRDMLVAMPPLREVSLCCRTRGNKLHVLCVLEAEEGVRLGQVFDALAEWETDGKGRIWRRESDARERASWLMKTST